MDRNVPWASPETREGNKCGRQLLEVFGAGGAHRRVHILFIIVLYYYLRCDNKQHFLFKPAFRELGRRTMYKKKYRLYTASIHQNVYTIQINTCALMSKVRDTVSMTEKMGRFQISNDTSTIKICKT